MLDAVATPREAPRPAPPPRALVLADAGPLHWLLRVACSAEFVGHGAFGIITKAAWLPYFGTVGIPPAVAWQLMPLIGSVDVTLGLLTLLRPARAVLLYMAFWGLLTATIRPLAGEPIWEFVERVPNWAVPLAFFGLRSRGRAALTWPRRAPLTIGRTRLDWLLRLAVAGALVGHGAYGAILAKPSWFDYFAVLGLSRSVVDASGLLSIVGGAEMALGLLVLVFPPPALLVFVGAWKIGTELLRPAAGEPIWEFVERASNMLAPLALVFVRGWPAPLARWLSWVVLLALSTGLASAMTFSMAGALARAPETNGPPTPSTAMAALADGDDVRARFLIRLYSRTGSDACETSGSRRPYAGLNGWTGAEPTVMSCAEGGP